MVREALRHCVLAAANRLGLDIRKIRHAQSIEGMERKAVRFGEVDFLIDVGANDGGYADYQRREIGYRGPIVSFEPLSLAFARLSEVAKADARWTVLNIALGDEDCDATINISGNSCSSSLLPMLSSHSDALPESSPVATESIRVRRLDEVMDELPQMPGWGLLKIDTQGFEAQVLRGAARTLQRIRFVELELSLVPLYEGQALFSELCKTMRDLGFALLALEPAFRDGRTGELLQLDGLFKRVELAP